MDADRVQEGVCEVCGKPGTLRLLDMYRGRELARPLWICSLCWIADEASAAERWRRIWETVPSQAEPR